MTQIVSLSSKAQILVNNYVNGSIAKSPFDSNIFKNYWYLYILIHQRLILNYYEF